MTERQFAKLALGDEIMNKRAPGIILKVTNRYIGPDGLQIEVQTRAGKYWVSFLRAKEYQQAYPQQKLNLETP